MNEKLRRRLKVNEKLKVRGVWKGLKWFQHVQCMSEEQLITRSTSLRRKEDRIMAGFARAG